MYSLTISDNCRSFQFFYIFVISSQFAFGRPSITFGDSMAETDPSAHASSTKGAIMMGGDFLPHCTRNLIMEGEVAESRETNSNSSTVSWNNISRRSGDGTRDGEHLVNVTSTSQFYMSLKETTCMVLKSNRTFGSGVEAVFSIMHTIEYLRLEHHYAISGKYKFAIPSIGQQCKCDCAGGDQICSIDSYQYKNCSAGALCYRTYLGNQVNSGCLSSGKSEVCCQMQIDPYRDWTFQAVRLKQPDTTLVLRYRIFERSLPSTKRWKNTVDDEIEIPLNRGIAKFELNNDHRIQIITGGGRPNRQVDPGMYFWQIGSDGEKLRGGVALNDLAETSLDKLGWLRWEEGRWNVRKGLVKLTQAQHVNVQDCKAQKYTSAFNAEQLVLRSDDGDIQNFELGTALIDEPWVGAISTADPRVIKIEHAEGTALMMSIRTESHPRIIHHVSQFAGFQGSIQLDAESNRYLNLTFQNARGTLIGQVFSTDSRTSMDVVFSVQTDEHTRPEFRAIVAVPASIFSQRLVCIYPAGDYDGQICHWLPYLAQPLQEYRVAHRWQQGHAECAGCNERGVDSVLVSLDPRNWLDGLNSPTEFFTCLVEIVLCFGAVLLSILILTKCIIPMFRCICAISRPPKKK